MGILYILFNLTLSQLAVSFCVQTVFVFAFALCNSWWTGALTRCQFALNFEWNKFKSNQALFYLIFIPFKRKRGCHK